MLNIRVIPCLLLRNAGLVKTVKFKKPRYIGDPINAVRIFNEKEVDELVFLDIEATSLNSGPNFELIKDIASEAFMPFAYGGGISSTDQIKQLFALGVEKIILNTAAVNTPKLIPAAVALAGSSSVVISIDIKRNFMGKYRVCLANGRKDMKLDPISHAKEMEHLGAGEILVNAIDRDGCMSGYDLDLIQKISEAVSIPVVASGGAGELRHFKECVGAGASAVAAGSMFVFHGRHKAVLITYPEYNELEQLFCQ
jgi:imidazole glycerol-phosphate synthase subunit HisF